MFPNATPEMHLEACKILIEKLPVEPINYRSVLYRSLDRPPRLITVNDFRFVWLAQLDRIRDQIEALKLVDIHPNYGEYSHQYKIPRRSSHEKKSKNVLERTRIRVSLHSYAQDVEENVTLWQHASFARLRIITRLRHPSLNRQEVRNY
jgi:hypothetical protein